MRKRLLLLVLGAALVTIVAWAPAVAVVLAYAVVGWTGCQVDEASAYPCQIGPVDVGGPLYLMGTAGQYFLATWTVALLALLFWAGDVIVVLGRKVRRRERS
jgi:hypothetical protein